MVEIVQIVNNENKDAILERYAALGWAFKSLRGCNDQLLELCLIWSSEIQPVYPDVSDLM